MEPSPSIFLRAARREVLSPNLFGAGLVSGSSPIFMHRLGEGLLQTILRHEQLPEILRKARPRQTALLARVATELDAFASTHPPAIAAALEAAADIRPGEADIVCYDQLAAALAEGIRALVKVQSACVPIVYSEAAAIEYEWRKEFEQARVALSEEDRDLGVLAPLPEPTQETLTACLRAHLPDDPKVEAANVRRLAGCNSKDVFLFDVVNSLKHDGAYVMRREPETNVTLASLDSEAKLLVFLKKSGLPVPFVLLSEAGSERFGGGFLIMDHVTGAPRSPETLGVHATEILGEIAVVAAWLHALEIPRDMPRFADAALNARQRMLANIESYYQRRMEAGIGDSLICEVAAVWLRTNVGCLDDTAVIVHGDFNLRNILLDGDRFSSVLDWELSHVSHPAEDLAYIRSNVEAVMPWEAFLDVYHQHSKHRISETMLRYFEVWCYFWQLALADSCFAEYCHNRDHNFLYASIAYAEAREKADVIARIVSAHPVL